MKKLLIANWKMKPATATEATRLAKASDIRGVFIAPPFAFLPLTKNALKKATLGSQDIFHENPKKGGAYTGAVSATMVKSLGAKFTIIGHSERRAEGDTNVMVNKKIRIALEAGLIPVLCVGEPEVVRVRGIEEAKAFVALQLAKDLSAILVKSKKIIIAYEPIWAIGTGKNDTPENAGDMALFIKELIAKSYKLKASVLYGGSVNVKNIIEFARQKEIDGFLVGGASVEIKEWKFIMKLLA